MVYGKKPGVSEQLHLSQPIALSSCRIYISCLNQINIPEVLFSEVTIIGSEAHFIKTFRKVFGIGVRLKYASDNIITNLEFFMVAAPFYKLVPFSMWMCIGIIAMVFSWIVCVLIKSLYYFFFLFMGKVIR